MIRRRLLTCLVAALLVSPGSVGWTASAQDPYVRLNQVGFTPDDVKSSILLSRNDLTGAPATIIDAQTGDTVLTRRLGQNLGPYGVFAGTFALDFSSITQAGSYDLWIGGQRQATVHIGRERYNGLVDSVLLFFRVQRCGSTDPLLHDICHRFDITGVITGAGHAIQRMDLAGGWHDAGDYIKFLNTTAYAAYTLMFAYEFDPGKFGGDANGDQIPDVLEEARIGVEWLLKARHGERELITQVQDLRDHEQGWRLPENDELMFDRPGFVGSGKNLVGLYAATLALAARLWRAPSLDTEFADRCLTAAENIYATRASAPDVDASGTGMYRDQRYEGKLALGAIELYLTTGRVALLHEATSLATAAGADYWWSWGDINSFAHYRVAAFDTSYRAFIRANLNAATETAATHRFSQGAKEGWGSTNSMLGVALQAILYKRLTGEATFDTLATLQRDFVLGRNPWGVSFVYNVGTDFSRHFHSQVAYFNGGRLPGAIAAGPVSRERLAQYPIEFELPDRFAEFQSDSAVYRDDRMDYVTNEPTITAAATALFVLGYYSATSTPPNGGLPRGN